MTPVIRPDGTHKFANPDLARGAGETSVRSPLRNMLDFQEAIGKTAQDAGEGIGKKINAVVEFIKETTGIDLTGPATLLTLLSDHIGIGPLQDILPKILGAFSGGIDLDAPNPIIDWITDHVPLAAQLAEVITGLADGDLDTIGRFFDALRAFMHFDLLDDAFDPVAAALSFVHQVLKPVGVLDGTSALAARNLFGDLAAGLFRLVPLSSIGDTNPNLLDDPQFQNGDGFDGSEGVDHDPTVGRNSLGSVRFTADGTDNQILSDPAIPVTAGQQISLAAYARWAGLTGAGNTLVLGVTAFNAAGAVAAETNVTAIAATGTSAAGVWTLISGTYTVPAGVTSIRLRLGLLANATAGQAWMDDADVHKTQKLPQAFTVDLPGDLDDLFSSAASTIADLSTVTNKVVGMGTAIFNKWFGRTDGTGSTAQVEQAIESIKDAVLNGYTVHTVTANEANWPVTTHTECIAIMVGGGQNGQNGTNGGSTVGRIGGFSGSYIAQPLNLAGISALDFQIGTAGNKSYIRQANTSTPHTGALVLESPAAGSIGGIATPLGYTLTASTPGKGGNGGGMGTGRDLPQVGESSAVAAGGAAGGNNGTWGLPGQPGGSVSAGAAVKCGGGGGGGGGAAVQTLNVGGAGGDGGYPGGGGGAGGNCNGTTNQVGAGGAGAIGVIWMLTR
ncbi:hypothetical protein [Mycolicibacterium llatzerense]|uniref:hypothetical protein n=1 Tax=Mycolicibacterium llatzerense TaxID=280871 RepID=UPI0021B5A450|nr:hypothetical protein [Mycolicibacterium llatzerense]MCT7372681.1 hypothetical protein [Mycolicibacterium llatzerense]